MADTKIDLEGLEDFDYGDSSSATGQIDSGQKQIDDKSASKDTETQEKTGGGGSWFGLFSLEYYQTFFDVTTNEVIHRVVSGMLPFPWKLSSVVSANPDLYGPFWLCMTLVLTTALSGNLAQLFSGNNQFEFHFHEVIVLATCIFSYTWCVPFFLWGFMLWRKTDERFSLLQLLTMYGYSMAIFIPLTLLWLINVDIIRWLLLVVAILLSGGVLVQALWQPFRNESKNVALVVMILVFLLHAGIAIGFKYYYFSSSLAPESLTATTPELVSHVTSALSHVTPTPSHMNTTKVLASRLTNGSIGSHL